MTTQIRRKEKGEKDKRKEIMSKGKRKRRKEDRGQSKGSIEKGREARKSRKSCMYKKGGKTEAVREG